MNLSKFKRVLTDPDEFILNGQLKSLALELLELVPMEGIEGSGLDPEEIMEVMLRAAVDTTSVNAVTTNASDTPNRKTAMDLLHTLEKDRMLDAVNDILSFDYHEARLLNAVDDSGEEPPIDSGRRDYVFDWLADRLT